MKEPKIRLPRPAAHAIASDLRGASRLAVDAMLGLTSLVETCTTTSRACRGRWNAVSEQPTRGITGLVYRSIRGVTRLVGGSIDALLARSWRCWASLRPGRRRPNAKR